MKKRQGQTQIQADERPIPGEVIRYLGESDVISDSTTPSPSSESTSSADELGREFGISGSTIERVRSIIEQGTPEQARSNTPSRVNFLYMQNKIGHTEL